MRGRTMSAVRQWQAPDVSKWLATCDLAEFDAPFSKSGVTGTQLLSMQAVDLLKLGIPAR